MTYPSSPGSKASGPSALAAQNIAEAAPILREKCLEALKHFGNLTADECAEWLGRSILSVRPRMSELLRLGLIEDANIRRPSSMGKSQTVWVVKQSSDS